MKHLTITILTLGLLLIGGKAFAQNDPRQPVVPKNLTEVGFLPGFKRALSVDEAERNPYADRVKDERLADSESESARIRRILEDLTVRGISRGPRGIRVLLGDIILEQGRELPDLLPGQTDRLVVESVSEKELEVSWLSEAGEKDKDGRKVTIPVDLEPKVEVILKGQLATAGESKRRAQIRIGSEEERALNRSRGRVATALSNRKSEEQD